MDHTTILRISDIYRKDFYLYNSENITRRIYEERARTELFGKPFTYAEIPFLGLVRNAAGLENEKKVWKTVLWCLASEMRGSDIRGFAEDNRGIALLLLDSNDNSLTKFLERLKKEFDRRNLLKYIEDTDHILERSFRYFPTELGEEND